MTSGDLPIRRDKSSSAARSICGADRAIESLRPGSAAIAVCGQGTWAWQRYRMSDEEIFDCVEKAVEFGYGTVVLQSGEDPELTCQRIAELVRRIKRKLRWPSR